MNYELRDNSSILDYKDSIFETILVEEGHPYFLDEHLYRLEEAGREILALKISREDIKAFVYKSIPKSGRFAIRIVCSINSCILSFRDVEYKGSGFLKVSSIIRNSFDIKYRYKTSDYKERLKELTDVRKSGFIDAIYLNEKSFVTSCSIANVFFIKDGRIYTSSIASGVLNGIVRKIIIENYDCDEGEYNISDILDSDGIFITNSLFGVLPIKGIGNKIVKMDERVFNQICEIYRLKLDCDRRKFCG